MRIFIRSMNPSVKPVGSPGERMMACGQNWIEFQALLRECLEELGHSVVERPGHPTRSRIETVDVEADFRIYAHQTRRDVSGDLFYKQMHLCNLFTLDHEGWGTDHSMMKGALPFENVDPETANYFCMQLREQLLASGISKHPQPARGPIRDLPDGYLFAPLQCPRDYVQVHHSPISVVDFIHALADWAETAEQAVVFKPHPANKLEAEIIQALEQRCLGSRHVYQVDGNIHDLIAGALAICTINSGVGFESLIHGKPVITFGNSDYACVTFRATAGQLSEARQYALRFTDGDRQRVWRFVYYYCFELGYFMSEASRAECKRRLLAYLAKHLAHAVRDMTMERSQESSPAVDGRS